MYIDSHTHYDYILKKNPGLTPDALIREQKAASIKYIVQVSTDIPSLAWSHELARRHHQAGVYFTLGLHPSTQAWDLELEELDRAVAGAVKENPQLLLGIGECGLDFYRMSQSREMQLASFEHQLYLAGKYNLPVIIHCRDAITDLLRVLQANSPCRGIMHCFQGNKNDARQFLDLGFYISFAGNVTYKNARDLQESAAYIPSDRLLIETDAPFLSPQPLRGKPNKPSHITHTYDFLAALRGQELKALQEAVIHNFETILKQRYK